MLNSTDMIIVNCSDHHNRLARGLWKYFSCSHGVDYDVGLMRAHRLVLDMFLSAEKLTHAVKLGGGGVLDFWLFTGKVTVPRLQLEKLLDVAMASDFKMLVDVLEHLTVVIQPGTESLYLDIGSGFNFNEQVQDAGKKLELNDHERQHNKDHFCLQFNDVNPKGYSSESRFFSQIFFKCSSNKITKSKDLIMVNCINHHDRLAKSIWNYFRSSHGVDYDVGSVRVHRLILDVFLSTKKLTNAVEFGGGEVLDLLLEVLYTGKVTVPRPKLEELLEVAKASDFKMLVDVLETLTAISQPGTASIYLDVGSDLNLNGQLDRAIDLELNNYESQYNANAIDLEIENVDPKQHLLDPGDLSQFKTMTLAEKSLTRQDSQIGNMTLVKESQSKQESESRPTEELENTSQIGALTIGEKSQSSQEDLSQSTAELGTISQIETSTLAEESGSNQERKSQSNCAETVQDGAGDSFVPNQWNLQVSKIKLEFEIEQPSTSLKTKRRKKKSHKCEICGLVVSCKDNLKAHTRIHTGERPFKCDICQLTFRRNNALKVHKMNHTDPRPFKCEICEKSFSQHQFLERHISTHTGEWHYKCDICEVTFFESRGLKRHQRTHTREAHFTCSLCDARFPDRKTVIRHVQRHTVTTVFSCDICLATFSRCSAVQNHIVFTHTSAATTFSERLNERWYKCFICSKVFEKPEELVDHSKIHLGGTLPFGCCLCEASFSTRAAMRIHKASHTNSSNRFLCNICKITCECSSHLENHLRTHSNERPYKCPICFMSFKQSSVLAKHIKNVKHMENKLFKCDVCLKVFKRKHYLTEHQRMHSGE